jgi:hypothetical protein
MTAMNFNLVRLGWPNIVPILALAAVPALAMLAGRSPHPAPITVVAMTEVCPQPADGCRLPPPRTLSNSRR